MSLLEKSYSGKTPVSIVLILIIGLVVASHHRLVSFDFINLDDNTYIYLNPDLKHGLTLTNISQAWTTFGHPYYMPLTRLSFLVDAELYGTNPGGYHFSNLLLHLINVFLLFMISRHFFRSDWSAGLVAFLFSIHPQHVEAVAWIAQRKELLAAFFGLISFQLYMLGKNSIRNDQNRNEETKNIYYLLSVLVFFLSLLSKPTWVTFPVLLIIIDWYYDDVKNKKDFFQILKNISPFLFLSVVYSIVHLYSVSWKIGHVITSVESVPMLQRIFNTPVILCKYLTTGIFPFGLTGYQPYPLTPLPIWQVVTSSAILIFILLVAISKRDKNRLGVAGLAWFFLALLPVVGLLGTGEGIFIGDRWTYLPHIGLFITFTCLVLGLLEKMPKFRYLIFFLVFAYISAMTVSNARTIDHWQNSGTFWSWSVDSTRENHYAHVKLGEYYESKGLLNEAEANFMKAHEIKPSEYIYVLYLGNLYSSNDPDKAWVYYEKMLTTAPATPEVLFKMGISLMVRRQYERAEQFFKNFVQTAPPEYDNKFYFFISHIYLFHLLSIADKGQNAREYLTDVLKLMPFDEKDNCIFVRTNLTDIETLTGHSETGGLVDVLCGPQTP